MNIIKSSKDILFECDKCSCLFTAPKAECRIRDWLHGDFPEADCPECKKSTMNEVSFPND